MKRQLLCALGLTLSLSLFASEGLDEKLFLEPNVQELAGKTALVNLNIGSNIPSTRHIVSTEVCKEIGLGAHFKLLAQKMEGNAPVVVSAPASYGVVFTDGSCNDEAVNEHIQQVLANIGSNADAEMIKKQLGELKEVHRATFAQKEGKLVLITSDKQLQLGEPIWRKTPSGVETNIYHSEEEYLVAFENAGFKVEEIKRPCFYGQLKYKMHRSSLKEDEKGLGQAYADHHPFTIFYLVKKA